MSSTPEKKKRRRTAARQQGTASSEERARPRPRQATIDRFEEELAVLLVDGRQVTRPRRELPAEAREGDVVDLDTLAVDAEATERLRAEVRRAREQALAGKAPPPGDFEL